jgi:hypothetical protein
MSHQSKRQRFQIGHVYIVDYDDHWSSESRYRSTENGVPVVLRQRGVCTRDTAKTVVLEHNTHLTDGGDKRADFHGILKFAIRRVQHMGKER